MPVPFFGGGGGGHDSDDDDDEACWNAILPHHTVKPECLITNCLQNRVINFLENAKLEVGKNQGLGGQSSLRTLYLNWHM